MSKTTFYRQCKLAKGNCYQTSWIPERFAVVDKVLKLRDDKTWDNGWVVKQASETRLSEAQLPDAYDQIKKHRKATGDNLPISHIDSY